MFKNKKGETMNKKLTIIRLEKILREMISKVDTRATNFKVSKKDGIDFYTISVDVVENSAFTYEGKFYPESKKLDTAWVCFGKNEDGVFFYSVDGIEGRHYFGHQDYNQNLQIAYSFIQQKLAPYNLHTEGMAGDDYDGVDEKVYEGTNLNADDLKENVFERKSTPEVQKAYSKAFERDYPEVLEKENL
jgi:hypothetical protein|tara:strand:- start:245 stop:811 length:567 start_codon:yes stop_codon:yes gene_type:complete